MQVAAIVGNLGAGYLPVLGRLLLPEASEIALFRVLLGFGTALAFLSLAFLGRLRETARPAQPSGAGRVRETARPAQPSGAGQVRETARPAQPSGAGLSLRLPGPELRTTLKFLIAGMLISFGASHFMPFMNVFFAQELLATPQQIGIIFAVAQATVAVATMMTPVLAKRIGPIRAITLVQALAIPLLFTMSWAPGLLLTSVVFALWNALMQMVNPIKGPLALGAVAKENRGKANGILVLGNNLASGAGSFSAGLIISAVGYGWSFRVAAVTYALSTALFWLFFRKMDQTSARSAKST
jgi:MFS family permease